MLHVNLAITKYNVQHEKVINFEIFFTLLHVIQLLLLFYFKRTLYDANII